MKSVSRLWPSWLSVTFFLSVWTLLGLIFLVLSYSTAVGERRPASVHHALLMSLVRFYIWAALTPLIFYFSSRFPVYLRRLRPYHLLLHMPAMFLFSSLHQLLFITAGWYIDPTFSQRFPFLMVFYRNGFLGGFYHNVLISLIIIITVHAFLYYQHYQSGQVQQSLLKSQLAQAQLQALKMQLHPHFLFNTLHSISSLVLEDPPKANSMIARLGDFLRLTLEHSEEQVVMLKEEIEFVRCYLEIEQVRFDDRLIVAFEIEPLVLSAHVPQMIIQPVVENALRHAIALHDAVGHIKIAARRLNGRLRLEVNDNGPGIGTIDTTGEQRGVGLRNVRARLEQLYGTEFCLELRNAPEGGLSVILEMPLQPASATSFRSM